MRPEVLVAAAALGLAACSGDERSGAPDRGRRAADVEALRSRGPSQAPREPGYRPTREELPRVVYRHHRWTMDGEPGGRAEPLQLGRPVVVAGRMRLRSPKPYRHRFVLVPDFRGCVDAKRRLHRDARIHVRMASEQGIRATDRRLRVQGTLRRERGPHGGRRLVLHATAAQPVDTPARASHGPRR